MRETIKNESLDWYKKNPNKDNVSDLVDKVISKTADNLFEVLLKEFGAEFKKGSLAHPYFISGEYYIELKLKD